MLNKLRKRMKFIKTSNLYLSLFVLGLAVSLTGPCLLDLQNLVRTDARNIAMIYTARSIGYLFGAIIGGILLDLTRFKMAILMTCNLFVTVTMFGIPWSRNLKTLMIFMCVNGLSLGAIETGSNVMCLELWGKDSNPVFQGLHLAFSVGGLLSPLIAAPFLENARELSPNMNNINNSTNLNEQLVNSIDNFSNASTNFTQFSDGIPKLIYPFSIVGAITLIITLLHVGVCLIAPTEDERDKETSKTDNSERSILFMFFTVIFTFAIFFVVAGTETGYAQTLTLYSVKGKLHLTTTQGAYITSALWAAFTVSRLICVFLSMKISCLKLLIGDISLVAISAIVFLFLMLNEWSLWIASIILGTGIASAYGAVVGWINTHIIISNKFSATFTVGGATGDMIVPFVITYFIDNDPEMFTYVTTASAVFMTILLTILYCMFKMGSKMTSKDLVRSVVDEIETKN